MKTTNLYASVFSAFLVGVATGMFIFRMFFLNTERINAMVEERAGKKVEELKNATRINTDRMLDSIFKNERNKLIFEYKRIITSDDVQTSKRIDDILDSLYRAH